MSFYTKLAKGTKRFLWQPLSASRPKLLSKYFAWTGSVQRQNTMKTSPCLTRMATMVVAALLVLLTGCTVTSPLRRSEDGIEKWVEKATPLGSSFSDVKATATRHGWYDANAQRSDGRVTGKFIRGDLGEYGFPFRTSVTAFWLFDANDRLISVRIWKTSDAP